MKTSSFELQVIMLPQKNLKSHPSIKHAAWSGLDLPGLLGMELNHRQNHEYAKWHHYIEPLFRCINGAIDQLLCHRVCSGRILKLTIHRGSFFILIYMVEAQHPSDICSL